MCPQKGETRPEETKENVAEVTKKKIAEESFLSRYLCWGNQRCQKRIFQTILRPKFLLRKVSSAATSAEKIRGVKSAFAEETFIRFRQFNSKT